MNRFYITMVLFLTCYLTQAQVMLGGKKTEEPVEIDSISVKVGDKIMLLEGTLPNGNFKYASFKVGNAPVQGAYSYSSFEVESFINYKHIDHPFIIAKQSYYRITINSLPAIRSGEIKIISD